MQNIKEVDGKKVVEWKTAYTGLKVPYQKVEVLVLEDGTETFGCTFPGCDKTGPAAFPLAGAHYSRKHKLAPEGWSAVSAMTLGELVEFAGTGKQQLDHANAKVAELRGKLSDSQYQAGLLQGKLNRRDTRLASEKVNADSELQSQLDKALADVEEYRQMAEQAVELADTYKKQVEALKGTLMAFGFNPQAGGN